MAGVVGLEPTTDGFGDRYSTIEPHPYEIHKDILIQYIDLVKYLVSKILILLFFHELCIFKNIYV